MIVLLMVVAFGGLAAASVFLTSNVDLFLRGSERDQMLRNAADAGLEMGRSRIDKRKSTVLQDIDTLYYNQAITDASGATIPGIVVTVYAGPTGSATGQFGSFLSIVSEAKDNRGNRFVRRQELTQESFAKFAYWTEFEKSSSGSTIVFAAGDQIRGPLWTNDAITIGSGTPKPKFWEQVRTAKTISNASNGDFVKGYLTNQPPMTLPPNGALQKLAKYALEGDFHFTAPNSLTEKDVLMRIEFVAADMNADGDSTDTNEGFFRVFTALAGKAPMLRPDLPSSPSSANVFTCGDWHYDEPTTVPTRKLKFYPAAVHNTGWFKRAMIAGGMSSTAANTEAALTIDKIAAKPNVRCYPAGDPHLVAVERFKAGETTIAGAVYDTLAIYKGGEDTTFTPIGKNGSWTTWPDDTQPTHPMLAARRPWDARYLHPIDRSMNLGSKGVIYVKGTVAVSGVVRGRVTLYADGGSIVIIDDLRYANDPGAGGVVTGACQDMLGMIAANDIVVADNLINTPEEVGYSYKFFDDTKDLFVHSVLMALNQSFRVENYSAAPDDATTCETKSSGRGCLYLTGGIIQVRRGAVGLTSGEGYVKRYSYDRCAADAPPPYFPVTGRYVENAYLEVDPASFDVETMFKRLSPHK
jgi:hypothetical protein